MAKLTEKQRDELPDSAFAYIDKTGERHLPIHDAAHVRNALARWNQTDFVSKAARERARKRILEAAKEFDIEVDEDDAVRKGG